MTRAVTQRPRARIALLEQFVYLGEHATVEVAESYLAAVEETCSLLAAQPLIGTPYDRGAGGWPGFAACPSKDSTIT